MREDEYQQKRFELIHNILECREKARELRRKMGLPDFRHADVPVNEETDPVRRRERGIAILRDRLWDAHNETLALQRNYRVFVHAQMQ